MPNLLARSSLFSIAPRLPELLAPRRHRLIRSPAYRIAKELGAERRGKISPRGGYFGALQLAAEVTARFRVPEGGGRATDPSWSEQRLVRLSPKTLEQLEHLAEQAHASPMQVAALLLERAVQTVMSQEQSG